MRDTSGTSPRFDSGAVRKAFLPLGMALVLIPYFWDSGAPGAHVALSLAGALLIFLSLPIREVFRHPAKRIGVIAGMSVSIVAIAVVLLYVRGS